MRQEKQFDYLFKIVIAGDSGVGKSNLLSKYVNNSFQENTKTTIGVELSTHTVQIQGKYIQNQIWDTAGQERFRAITSAYYRNAVGAIIVFDLTKTKSFESLSKWLREVQQYAQSSISVVVVGNKSDLSESREIKQETIQDFMSRNNLSYIETSALSGQNVQQAFKTLIQQIYHKQKRQANDKRKEDPGYPAPNLSAFPEQSNRTKINNQKKQSVKKTCC